jgi:hypothetical protein
MAATLNGFGDPIGDRTLVLTLLRGVSGSFCPIVTNIKSQKQFPTFAEARTMLLLEEIDLDDVTTDTDTPPAPALPALVIDTLPTGARGHSGRGPSSGAPNPSGGQGTSSGTGGGQGNRQCRRGRGGRQQQLSVLVLLERAHHFPQLDLMWSITSSHATRES